MVSLLDPECELLAVNLEDEPAIQRELTWGLSYRALQQEEKPPPMKQKHSPLNIPFLLCRALHPPCRKKKKPCVCGFPKPPEEPISLLARSALCQRKYMELLAKPTSRSKKTSVCGRKKKKIICKKICYKCELEPCTPRLVQLAYPTKRLVWENWKMYQNCLPAEILARFDQILKSWDNLEPRDARCYFKQLSKQRRRELKRRKRLCRKKLTAEKCRQKRWLKLHVDWLANLIVEYIKCLPLFMLNYRQMMTSNELIRYLGEQKVVQIKTRNTKNVYKKTVIEICDKIVKWMDNINSLVDLRPLDSREKLEALLEVPSLEELIEEEEEEEMEEEAEEEEEGEEEVEEEEEEEEQFTAEKLLDKARQFLAEECECSLFDLLDEDILAKLILLLSLSPDSFLETEVDRKAMPGVTYADVLDKLKMIRDGRLDVPQQPPLLLEDRMIVWANRNDAQQVDAKILDKIHETAAILEEWFRKYGRKETDLWAKQGLKALDERIIEEKLEDILGEQMEEEEKVCICITEEEYEFSEAEEEEFEKWAQLQQEEEEEELGVCVGGLEGIILGHKPSKVFEHAPGTICCLSLKIWAVWLLEIAKNAHKWTQWVNDIIKQVRHFAAIIRGEVCGLDGETQVLRKAEWRQFVKDTEEKLASWQKYSEHVKELSAAIIENFHEKKVNCCPKCLQDHLIKNVCTAHETLQALKEAINCAAYWQNALNAIVEKTRQLTELTVPDEVDMLDTVSVESEESGFSIIEINEIAEIPEPSEESLYEIEELSMGGNSSEYEIIELVQERLPPPPPPPERHERREKPEKKRKKARKHK